MKRKRKRKGKRARKRKKRGKKEKKNRKKREKRERERARERERTIQEKRKGNKNETRQITIVFVCLETSDHRLRRLYVKVFYFWFVLSTVATTGLFDWVVLLGIFGGFPCLNLPWVLEFPEIAI